MIALWWLFLESLLMAHLGSLNCIFPFLGHSKGKDCITELIRNHDVYFETYFCKEWFKILSTNKLINFSAYFMNLSITLYQIERFLCQFVGWNSSWGHGRCNWRSSGILESAENHWHWILQRLEKVHATLLSYGMLHYCKYSKYFNENVTGVDPLTFS